MSPPSSRSARHRPPLRLAALVLILALPLSWAGNLDVGSGGGDKELADTMVVREMTTANRDNPGTPASATCGFQNLHPMLAANGRATIICINFPGS